MELRRELFFNLLVVARYFSERLKGTRTVISGVRVPREEKCERENDERGEEEDDDRRGEKDGE